MKKHQKHTKLVRPDFGNFGRQEWAILGTHGDSIQQLSRVIIEQLSPSFNLGYVDTDDDAGLLYTNRIDYHRFDPLDTFNAFQYRQWFNAQDAVLVNGNHFEAQRQIVVIDQKKKDSLQHKLDQLNDVQLILFAEGEAEIYDFLKAHLPNWAAIPTYSLGNTEAIANWVLSQIQMGVAPLYGLVLAGGRSQRMGQDKAQLNYHGIPQYQHVHTLLKQVCDAVYLSCRSDQGEAFSNFDSIKDSFTDLGPFGAILSAFREHPNAAWLVMAVDLPLVDSSFLQELVTGRNPSKQATAFLNPATNAPDPLLTIWEPRSYATLLQFLAQGYACPKKVLIHSAIELLEAKQTEKLRNVNSPEVYAEVKRMWVDG